jgi:ABC-2 type transport system permease protein
VGRVLSISLGLIGNSIVFWEPPAQSAIPMVVMSMRDLARFPLDVYDTGIRVVLTYALVAYVPTSVVLHKPGSHGW